jgi:hypothetical protein
VFDERDPTAARPATREKARELCSEHMTEWTSSGSGDLTNLRIGIPQVRTQPLDTLRLSCLSRLVRRNTSRLHSIARSYLLSAALFAPLRIAERACSPSPSQTPATP